MRLENAVAADVLERILSAYGFTMQKELSDKLGIAKSNVASWLQRGQVPGNVLVQCALDTGADVQWLVTGEFANANMCSIHELAKKSSLSGQSLIKTILQSGGKPVLQRILKAYGFKTQKELSEYLGISTGTISTWVRREFFPGDVVITCSIDTGTSLSWLATGMPLEATNERKEKDTNSRIPSKNLSAGNLKDNGYFNFDITFISSKIKDPVFVYNSADAWLVDFGVKDVCNGSWLLDIHGKKDVYNVSILPGKKINVSNKTSNFTCSEDEVGITGFVVLTMKINI